MNNFWEDAIKLHVYTYYLPRPDFVSPDSMFSSWVTIIPAKGEFEWRSHDSSGNEIAGSASFGDQISILPSAPFWRRAVSPLLEYHVFQWSLQHQNSKKFRGFPQGKTSIEDRNRLFATLELLKVFHGKTGQWSYRRQSHLLEEIFHLAWQTQVEPKRIMDPAMNDAAELLRKRAGDFFSMKEISTVFGLGQVQFTRRFHEVHGCNPIEFLTQVRLEMAQELLIETNLPLDEIAFQCGWSSGAYLSHVFKKQMRVTPGHFRRSRRF